MFARSWVMFTGNATILNRSLRLGKLERFAIRASLLRGTRATTRTSRFAFPGTRLARITKRLIFSKSKNPV